MSRILFVTYEFHPTTWGGCGVLLRHATDLLLSQGHEVDLLLDIPKAYFDRFEARDGPTLSVPERCYAHHADALCQDIAWNEEEIGNAFVWKSLRFAHAVGKLTETLPIDFVEFFEYCGVGYHAFVEKRFGLSHGATVMGTRVHNSVELIDSHEGTKPIDRDRAVLYGLEHAALAHSESTLLPSQSYADRYYLSRYALPAEAIEISEPPTVRFPRRVEKEQGQRREIQFFGRIFEFKGVDRFVRAAILLLESQPDLDVDFVLIGNDSHDAPGGGSYTEHLKRCIPKPLLPRFEFTGHLTHDEALDRFGRALFAVFPNQFESFCYAAHEISEAGVPMLVSDIPAFRNYLEEGVNAFYFDGGSVDLARKMARLVGEPELLAQLKSGERLALDPLGPFYSSPRALRPIGGEVESTIRITLVVLVPPQATDAHLARTLDAVRPQLDEGDVLLLAYEEEDPRVGREGTSIQWMGGVRRIQSAEGEPVALSDLRTTEALWLLLAGDQPGFEFVDHCRRALSLNSDLGFAGTWMRDSEGRLLDGSIDLLPERYPFEVGARLSRVLLRTEPEFLLVEVFHPQAGIYGEIGALWNSEEAYGRGCLLARTMMQTSPLDRREEEPSQLAYLVQSVASGARRERIALLAVEGVQASETGTTPPEPGELQEPPYARRASPSIGYEQAKRIADETLDGKTLTRLAVQKLRQKLTSFVANRSGRGG